MRRRASRLALGAGMTLLAAAFAARAEMPASLRTLRQAFRCELVDRLARIHAGDRSTSRDRFIAVWPRGRPDGYVQCIFRPGDAAMLCEAHALPIPGHEEARRRLGFRPAETGPNDAQELALGTPPALGLAADLILRTLHDADGLRPGTPLQIRAPKAPPLTITPMRCAPEVS